MADTSHINWERYFNDPNYRREEMQKRFHFTPRQKWIAAGVLLLLAGLFVYYLMQGLPSLEKIENPKPELASKVYSIDGEVIGQFFVKNRSHISLKELPPTAVNALLATEDIGFRDHWGVDMIRFAKAMVKNVFALRLKEGASTITQQLARNLYLEKDTNIFEKVVRKIREFITSVQLERRFTKDEILEFYFNVVYFGRTSYGIASASEVFFGKPPSELSLTQTATLIGLLKGPNYYDPINHPARATTRRNIVLSQMEKYGFITSAEAERAKQERLVIKSEEEIETTGIAPHFVEYVRQLMTPKAAKYDVDLYRDGLSIYTTLHSKMQRYANQAVEEHLTKYQEKFEKVWDWKKYPDARENVLQLSVWTSKQYRRAETNREKDSIARALRSDAGWVDSMLVRAKQIEVGFAAINPKDGNVLAMVGGSNTKFRYGLNHVAGIKRQAGSSFKPFVYTVAIDNGYAPTYELLNQPVTLVMPDGSRWTPENTNKMFGGRVTIREAIKRSINLVAVRAIMDIAPKRQVVQYAKRMGISSKLPAVESLALGSAEVSPLELTSAFGVFANHGVLVDPVAVLRIVDKNGNVIEETYPSKREALSDQTAFIMTSMMQDVVDEGTASRGVRTFFNLPAAGKTGTTNDYADAWFVGFTPQIVAGVWVGFDNKTVHFIGSDGEGGKAAAPIWGRFMKYTYADKTVNLPVQYFNRPGGVSADSICTETKELARLWCPKKRVEYFTSKMTPESCRVHSTLDWRLNIETNTGTINY